jgi:thiol-disulfide isomerase/thioredoxin
MRSLSIYAFALMLCGACAVAQGQTPRTRRAGAKTPARVAAKTPAAPTAPLPLVAELNLEGLKKLLARGDDPAQARPLLVNFWATWCDPCRAEFPDLVKINDDYKTRGLEFALVSADDVAEIKTSVPKFLQQMNAGMTPYLLNVPDVGEAVNLIDNTWGGELPATYLYDRAGHVVFKHSGRVDPKELRAALDKVLAN